MAELKLPLPRALARFGTGCGVVVDGGDLVVTLGRVRPQGARLVAALRIEGFRERPAAEWGAEYAHLLQAHGAADARALLVLPRHEVIVRTLKLAGVRDEDAPAAIRFQLDALHPYGDDEVGCDFQRAGRSDAFVVAIAERRTLEFYTALFAEAGVALAGITFSGGAVYSALRLFDGPPAEGFVAVAGLKASDGEEWELYGESPSHTLFSARLDAPLERAVQLAAAELRLDGAEARDLIDLLPAWQSAPDDSDFSEAGRSRARAGVGVGAGGGVSAAGDAAEPAAAGVAQRELALGVCADLRAGHGAAADCRDAGRARAVDEPGIRAAAGGRDQATGAGGETGGSGGPASWPR